MIVSPSWIDVEPVTATALASATSPTHLPLVAKMIQKGDLPAKICAKCGLPFVWRKKWARDWDQVKYCSERCRRSA